MTEPSLIVANLKAQFGLKTVLTEDDAQPYNRGYRYGCGRSLCVVRPSSVPELRRLVRFCVEHRLGIVPQGANTGLVGAASPDESGLQVVLSLARLSGVENLNPLDRTATVLSGTLLSNLNSAAAAYDLMFPIDLGADPSVGGMVATNTGGARLIQYGDVRHNILGLEVIVLDEEATIISDLQGLRKDNSRIDWKQLFIGTGGVFGIITRVQLELHQRPTKTLTSLLVPSDHANIPKIVQKLEHVAGDFLTAVEGMSKNAMASALRHNPSLRSPFEKLPDYALLVELSSTLPEAICPDLSDVLNTACEPLLVGTPPMLDDVRVGHGREIWAMRHSISDGIRRDGRVIAFDISMPRSRLPEFRREAVSLVEQLYPFLRICDFGHSGDGGDHFNIIWPHDCDQNDLQYETVFENVRTIIYDLVRQKYGGSFSAEHGIGPHNIEFYRRYTTQKERKFSQELKNIFDKFNLINNFYS